VSEAAPERSAGAGDPDARGDRDPSLDRIATVPNLLSAIRIAAIPVFVLLLLHHGTEAAGLIILGIIVSTDWIDGYIARHAGQVSTVGKVLDPVADRLALASALIALMVRHAVPLWAGLLVIGRDGAILAAGGILLLKFRVRIDVRWIGKAATFALMLGIPLIAWANFGLWLHGVAKGLGWFFFVAGITAYYAATLVYAADMVSAVRRRPRARDGQPDARRTDTGPARRTDTGPAGRTDTGPAPDHS
jgi:cardiolipin synthase